MRPTFFIAVCLATISQLCAASTSISATPHASYSSSIGVLGCKVNTDRIAYWPMSPDCNDICVQLSYSGRSVYLLRVDQSGGAYDVSFDAFNYLLTGFSATEKPTASGPVEMTYDTVEPSKCSSLISTSGHKLPLSAANSMNFVSSCIANSTSWVAKNYLLYNIMDPLCSYGYDETCTLDLTVSNQPKCPHTLGLPTALTGDPVYNIEYPSGQKVLANGQTAATSGATNLLRFYFEFYISMGLLFGYFIM